MAVATANFDSWLSSKLQELKTDESVFGSYIKGILEGDETEAEKTEALEGILAGITEDNIEKHVTEILEAWVKWGQVDEAPVDNTPKEDVDVRLVRMLESQSLPTTSHKSNHTEEEKRIKEAILAQYSQMSDNEESKDEEDEEGGDGGGCDSGLEKNTNVATIIHAERERRERAKQESAKKKEKDKEDREKQKLLKEEKKEKRKTQKGERRR
ncbi:coiled-coil domain-containing protein 43 [Nasonia vitripennis]|uniref:Coiled-coil domain-containing protein 43 n=1 Tax=Nasonia vitripennis TaxID=7425 RepID=A0A7M7G5S7_NASVI|nr:coiled-coil domain-containing protein 43 [Nasonia vitripennis]